MEKFDYNNVQSAAESYKSSSSVSNFSKSGKNSVFRGTTEKSQEKQFKVICVGESMVGKTSLIQRYIQNNFEDHGSQPTLSWDFKVKTVQLGEKDPITGNFDVSETVRMFVWDTAGQERFR